MTLRRPRAAVQEHIDEGATPEQMAEYFDVTVGEITEFIEKHGLKRRWGARHTDKLNTVASDMLSKVTESHRKLFYGAWA